jgi:hypothetical protein
MEIGTVSSTGFGTLITIANYSKYQGDGDSFGASFGADNDTSGPLLGRERNHFGDSTGTASDTTNESSSTIEKSGKSGNDGDSIEDTLGIGSDSKKGQSRPKTGIQYKKYKNKEVEESILTAPPLPSLDARSRPRDGLLKDGEGYAFATSDESDGSEDGFFTFEEHEERKRRGLE